MTIYKEITMESTDKYWLNKYAHMNSKRKFLILYLNGKDAYP